MRRERPPAVLVMAILSTVFGILFLLGALSSTLTAVLMCGINIPVGGVNPSTGPAGTPQLIEIPGYLSFLFATAAFDLVFSSLLLVSGIALFRMKPFARRAAIVFGVAVLFRQVAGMLIQALYLNPALAKALQEQMQGVPRGLTLMVSPLVLNAQALMYAFFPTAYAAALLVVMFLPGVRSAFAKPEIASLEEQGSADT